MNDLPPTSASTPAVAIAVSPQRSWKRAALIVLVILMLGSGIAAATSAWWVKHHFYASPIRPVSLNQEEKQALDSKLETLEKGAAGTLAAKPGEEERTLVITSREINAYLAAQNLGETFKVDLGQLLWMSASAACPCPTPGWATSRA
jgi:hypothetical protein